MDNATQTEPPQPVTVVTQSASEGTVLDIKHGDYALRGDREWIRRHIDWAMRHGRTVIVTPGVTATQTTATQIEEARHAA